MKTDLDGLMQAAGLDGILISGPAQHNPVMAYWTGAAFLTEADILLKRGAQPVLFYRPMERGEASRTGLQSRSLAEYPIKELLKQSGGDMVRAVALRYQRMLTSLGLTSGKLALYGNMDAGKTYAIFSVLQQLMPHLELVGDYAGAVLLKAMATKDAGEVERIRRIGQVTTAVVDQTADFLTAQRVRDGMLVKADGAPLTVADVKSRINLWLAERGAENPDGTIFAIGREAAIPHSSGTPEEPLRLGQTIVFDIFPCEAGGGYFYDMTRTWCLGYAPDQVLGLYEDVLAVYRRVQSELRPHLPGKDIQQRACELFEARGHPTTHTHPDTEEGYVHGLGHGLGLHIHENPLMTDTASDADLILPGVVVTVEPGLYYPQRGMGVRLEDPVYMHPDGSVEVLVDYPLDLVLPVKKG